MTEITSGVLVDSNVIIDILTEDPRWYSWSAGTLEDLAEHHELIINPLIYSEISLGFERIEDLDAAVPDDYFRRDPLPWEAGFLAGRCFLDYRRAGGRRQSTLPDFYIGAHATIRGYELLTRDVRRYRSYFPSLTLVSP